MSGLENKGANEGEEQSPLDPQSDGGPEREAEQRQDEGEPGEEEGWTDSDSDESSVEENDSNGSSEEESDSDASLFVFTEDEEDSRPVGEEKKEKHWFEVNPWINGIGLWTLRRWSELNVREENKPAPSQPLRLEEICVKNIADHMKMGLFFICSPKRESKPLYWPLKDLWTVAETLNISAMKQQLFEFLMVRYKTDEVLNLLSDVVKTSPRFMKNLLAYVEKYGNFKWWLQMKQGNGRMDYSSEDEEIMEKIGTSKSRKKYQALKAAKKQMRNVLTPADQLVSKIVSDAGYKDSRFAARIHKAIVRGQMDAALKKSFFQKIMGKWNSDRMMAAVELLIEAHPNRLIDLWTFAMNQMAHTRFINFPEPEKVGGVDSELEEEEDCDCDHCRKNRNKRKRERMVMWQALSSYIKKKK